MQTVDGWYTNLKIQPNLHVVKKSSITKAASATVSTVSVACKFCPEDHNVFYSTMRQALIQSTDISKEGECENLRIDTSGAILTEDEWFVKHGTTSNTNKGKNNNKK